MVRKLEQVPDCKSISQLQSLDMTNLSGDQLLFIVSEKYPETETGYISKNMPYGDLVDQLYPSLGLDITNSNLKVISGDVDQWNDFKNSYLSAYGTFTCNINRPYVISSMQIEKGMVIGVSGYYLSTAMDIVFKSHKFTQISASHGYFNDLYIDGRHLTYEDIVKDQFLSDVQIIGNQMLFTFALKDEAPRQISTMLSNFAGIVGMRDWTNY